MTFSLFNRFNSWSAHSLQNKFHSILLGYFRKSDTSGYDETGSIAGLPYTLLGSRDLDQALLVIGNAVPVSEFALHVVPGSYIEKKVQQLPSNSPETLGLDLLSAYNWEVNNGTVYIMLSPSHDITPYEQPTAPRYNVAVQRFAPAVEAVKQLFT